ncbi:hypothetical protein HK098_006339 [Nowakowskiella sp. JEL0407]|nr:hypothetical protein HK098_006339 [Nowakowskiella sp. JEL0407]
MSAGRTSLIAVLLLAGAFATNPDEASFRKYIETSMKSAGNSTWIEQKLVANISTMVYKRVDYKFWSVVSVPEEGVNYIGIFGVWIPIPTMAQLQKMQKNAP